MTAGLLEPFDEQEAAGAGCDGILKKPFEASLLLKTIKPLVSEAQLARGLFVEQVSRPVPPQPPSPSPPSAPNLDPERVEAAITLALDAALPALVREITERVLIALGH